MLRPSSFISTLTLLALGGLAGCPEIPGRTPIGGDCGHNGDCFSGLCHPDICLDPLADDDGDGLLNTAEAAAGTNPVASDTDGDGLSDAIEVGPLPTSAPDSDGDGLPDAVEHHSLDTDQDCLPDDQDPHNTVPEPTTDLLVLHHCALEGPCASEAHLVTATCVEGIASCDHSELTHEWVAFETLCDGIDEDCDGIADDDFAIQESPPGGPCPATGACGPGIVECSSDGHSSQCSTALEGSASQSVPELCDKIDNDCDGHVDEGMSMNGLPIGSSCVGSGACADAPGIIECDPALLAAVCSVDLNGTSSLASPELCDGLDNDCDGATDEGIAFLDPLQGDLPVGTPCGQGACEGGLVVCSSIGSASCSTTSLANSELCDGIDNDCDGITDEEMFWFATGLGAPCEGLGECGAGLVECSSNGGTLCSTMAGGSLSQATEETCDGLDNNCDGIADNGITLDGVPLGSPCDAPEGCHEGIVECLAGGLAQCSTAPGGSAYDPTPETCDGVDNDCDGDTDEELPAAPTGEDWVTGSPLGTGPISHAQTAFDALTGRLHFRGGTTTGGAPVEGTWSVNLHTGIHLKDATDPPPIPIGSMVHDAEGARLIAFGENTNGAQHVVTLDLTTGSWEVLSALGASPQGVEGATAVLDSAEWGLYRIGGKSAQGTSGELWYLDLQTSQWTPVTVNEPLASAPYGSAALHGEAILWSVPMLGDSPLQGVHRIDLATGDVHVLAELPLEEAAISQLRIVPNSDLVLLYQGALLHSMNVTKTGESAPPQLLQNPSERSGALLGFDAIGEALWMAGGTPLGKPETDEIQRLPFGCAPSSPN